LSGQGKREKGYLEGEERSKETSNYGRVYQDCGGLDHSRGRNLLRKRKILTNSLGSMIIEGRKKIKRSIFFRPGKKSRVDSRWTLRDWSRPKVGRGIKILGKNREGRKGRKRVKGWKSRDQGGKKRGKKKKPLGRGNASPMIGQLHR